MLELVGEGNNTYQIWKTLCKYIWFIQSLAIYGISKKKKKKSVYQYIVIIKVIRVK